MENIINITKDSETKFTSFKFYNRLLKDVALYYKENQYFQETKNPPDFSFFLIKITYFSTSWVLGISSENMLFLKLTYLVFRDPLSSELVSVVISFPSISFSFSTNFKFYSFD